MSDERRILTPVAAALLKAADYIEVHGWVQGCGQGWGSVPPMCASVALRAAAKSQRTWLAARGRLCTHIDSYFITQWNDTPGRTKDEVVAALRGAAAECL